MCCRNQGTYGDPAGAKPAVESGLPVGLAFRGTQVPLPERDRRLQPGMAGHGCRYGAVGHARRKGAGPDCRDAGLPLMVVSDNGTELTSNAILTG